jgi:hypothetical protein
VYPDLQPNVTRTSPETASGRRQSRIERAHAGPTACPDALTGHAGWFGRDCFLPGGPSGQARAAQGRGWLGASATFQSSGIGRGARPGRRTEAA